tara:strand:+ start:318 stop:569 length:252 start_codon:yes stop_codon:yes gene_type:complete
LTGGDSFQHIRRAVTILNTGAVDLEADEQSDRVGHDMALALLDPLAPLPDKRMEHSLRGASYPLTPPLSVVLTLWLSMIPAVG